MTTYFRFRNSERAAWVQWVRPMLVLAGVTLLGYVGFTLTRAYLYQMWEGRAFSRTLHQRKVGEGYSGAGAPSKVNPHHVLATTPPDRGEFIAQLEIPRIGLNTLVLEGDDTQTLRLGAGHIPGTSFPGESGNVAIAGHRDTFFRRLRNIAQGDAITLRTPEGSYNYRVEALSVVTPNEVGVLGPTPANILTLVTCYPFHFVGAAPNRFIVRARQITPYRRYSLENDHKIKLGKEIMKGETHVKAS
jgi:sortase A